MDLTLTDEQSAIRELAARILEERLPAERLRELEATDTWHADDVWRDLGAAGLLGAAVPEADGGLGFGLLEACLVAEEIGRRVAPLPYLSVAIGARSEEHTSELQSLMRTSYAVFCLKKKNTPEQKTK